MLLLRELVSRDSILSVNDGIIPMHCNELIWCVKYGELDLSWVKLSNWGVRQGAGGGDMLGRWWHSPLGLTCTAQSGLEAEGGRTSQ